MVMNTLTGLTEPDGTEDEEPRLIEPSMLAAFTAPIEVGVEPFVNAAQ